jgi:pimeloyl-ACP methyl ester carboxylesterase
MSAAVLHPRASPKSAANIEYNHHVQAVESASNGAAGARVLYIPGLDGDPGLMRTAAPWLFRGLRVLAFDHRLDPMTGGVEGLAERALAVLDADAETVTPAFVCGESFGGTAALTLARRYPTRIRGLILLSAFGWYPSVANRAPRLCLALWRVLGDRAAACLLRWWRPLSLLGALGIPCSRDMARAYLRRPAPDLPGYRVKCEVSLHFDARPWLDSIACPTLILTGTWDPVVPTCAGEELARRIPNARLHRLPGGHLPHVARPTQAGELISGWLASSTVN